jgi:anti-sigma factor RsiW
MNCPLGTRENAEQLLDYCSRNLDPQTTTILERHIAACPACREFVDKQSAVWQALDAWEAKPVSADFDRKLYTRIEADVPWWQTLLRPLRPVALRWNVAASMAGVFVLLTAGLLLNRPGAVSPVPEAPTQAQGQLLVQPEQVQPEQVEHALDAMDMLAEFDSHVKSSSGGNAKM